MPAATEIKTNQLCTHCGEPCDDTSILSDTNNFCCVGCKTVFEILHENGLEDFYKLESRPGISLKNPKDEWQYEFLEDSAIEKKVLEFRDKNLAKATFYIPVIHCASCIWLLENVHQLQEGILTSRVDFGRKNVSMDFDPEKIPLRKVVEFLSQLGYNPEFDFEAKDEPQKRTSKKQRELLVKIGVAGFCFGNIMLFSFPEYIGMNRLNDSEFSRFFGYISMAFSLPVLLYSAAGYFGAAQAAIKHKSISIDVPIVLGILALFLRSSYEVLSATGSGYFDSLSGLVFFLLVGKWFQQKTYDNLLFDRKFQSYFPVSVTKIIDEKPTLISINDLKPGDLIEARNQELIPADSSLLSDTTYIDNSFVTGESAPVSKVYGDYIFAGGRQVGPRVRLKIEKEVSQSYLTKLWENDAFKGRNQKQLLINKISRFFTLIVLVLALGTAGYWYVVEPALAINAFTAVLIVACPCALALSTPFAVGNAMRILGAHDIYLKSGDVVESMAKASFIFFDKTGTITRQSEARQVVFEGQLTDEEKAGIATLVSNSMHPLSRIIEKKMHAYVSEASVTEFTEVKGAGLTGVIRNKCIKVGSQAFTGSHVEERVGFTVVGISVDGVMKGHFYIQSSYRMQIENVINAFNKFHLGLLSGDNSADKTYLKEVFPHGTELYFEQSAFDKIEKVKEVQDNDEVVMMLGDGLNDAGALAQADIGVAVADDVSNFTPASDVIVSGASFELLPGMLQLAQRTKWVIKASFVLSFLYNLVGLSFAVSGALTPIFAAILMPLSSISVVVFATLSIQVAAKKSGFN